MFTTKQACLNFLVLIAELPTQSVQTFIEKKQILNEAELFLFTKALLNINNDKTMKSEEKNELIEKFLLKKNTADVKEITTLCISCMYQFL